jgi:acetyltransferase-like isoleucine patch superfamily enzyme
MSNGIGKNTSISSVVILGEDATIDDFSIIGQEKSSDQKKIPTQIGKGCIIRSHSVIYGGNNIGINFQTGHGVLIREFNTIGDHVSVGTHSVIEHHTQIGNNVRIHSNAFIPEYSVIEDGAWIGPNVVFTNAQYPASVNAKVNLKGPHIMQNAKIGANATILPGVTIGRNALVGAGSVVVHDVADGKVVAGNPAKVIGDIMDIPDYKIAPDSLDLKEEL